MDRQRLVNLLAAVAACLAMLLLWSARARWITDDALITFRYVDNLIAGDGLVYNPGERLEAFSSPLFVLLLAPLALVGADLFVSVHANASPTGISSRRATRWAAALICPCGHALSVRSKDAKMPVPTPAARAATCSAASASPRASSIPSTCWNASYSA